MKFKRFHNLKIDLRGHLPLIHILIYVKSIIARISKDVKSD